MRKYLRNNFPPWTMDKGQIKSGSVYGDAAAPLVVLLQGPVGPFFRALGMAMLRNGWRVIKINLNLGDTIQNRGLPSILYRDDLAQWESWLNQFLAGHRPEMVILFGDQRPYHRVAVQLCRELGIEVWCMEEGYLRPHYITVESGGNNAASSLPRQIGDFEVAAGVVALPQSLPDDNFRPMAWAAVKYFSAMKLGALFLRQYVHHRNRPAYTEIIFWLRNAWRKQCARGRNACLTNELIKDFKRRYFVVALQVHDDLQVRVHGQPWSMEAIIDITIRSFARHALPGERLVFKTHPMDRGHRSYYSLVRELASLARISDRVFVIDDGLIGPLLSSSRGFITLNSTSGLLALRNNCPVFLFGDAIFRIDGLVSHGDEQQLNRFWRLPFAPSRRYVDNYFSHLIIQTQINGSFYLKNYLDFTVRNVLDRILARHAARMTGSHQGIERLCRKPRLLSARHLDAGGDNLGTDRT